MTRLTRWDPFFELSRHLGSFDRSLPTEAARFTPAVDIREEDDALVLVVDVPGVAAEDIDVSIDQNVLTLKGERRLESEEKRDDYHRIERSHGSFVRSFVIPKSVNPDEVDAALEQGILTLRLPKRPRREPRTIAVRQAG